MLPVGDLYVAGRFLHGLSLLLFAALAQLIETRLQVRSLLSLTIQLLFKLANHSMCVARVGVASTATGIGLARCRTVRACGGGCLLLRSGLTLESLHALGLATSAR